MRLKFSLFEKKHYELMYRIKNDKHNDICLNMQHYKKVNINKLDTQIKN